MIRSVLVYIINDNKVLLGKRKSNYAKNKWNGFGGKVEHNESLEEAAVREVYEECGVTINKNDLILMARIKYMEPDEDWEVNAYICNMFFGLVIETDEMFPKWFSINELPLDDMWENDRYWLEKVLVDNKKVEAFIENDAKGNVIKMTVKELEL